MNHQALVASITAVGYKRNFNNHHHRTPSITHTRTHAHHHSQNHEHHTQVAPRCTVTSQQQQTGHLTMPFSLHSVHRRNPPPPPPSNGFSSSSSPSSTYTLQLPEHAPQSTNRTSAQASHAPAASPGAALRTRRASPRAPGLVQPLQLVGVAHELAVHEQARQGGRRRRRPALGEGGATAEAEQAVELVAESRCIDTSRSSTRTP